MSFNPHGLSPIPSDTAALGKRLLKPGKSESRFVRLSEEIDHIFENLALQAFYPEHGQWGIHPYQVICLLILQAMEGLTDRQAAEATQLNVGWKYVLRLPLDHEGWTPSAFSKHRDRFAGTSAMTQLLDEFLKLADRKGFLNTVKQRADSTHIIGYVRDLNRTELILETVRNALEALADEFPDWLLTINKPEWMKRFYFDRPFNYRVAKTPKGQIDLAEDAGADGFYILEKIEECEPKLRHKIKSLEEIKILEQVLEQQFSKPGGKNNRRPKLKDSKDLAPSGDRIISPYETEARAAVKGSTSWLGYKAHTTETCVRGFPNLITDVTTTKSTENDSLRLADIAKRLVSRGLQPLKLLVDCGYVKVPVLNQLKTTVGIDVVARLANGHSWQSKENKGFDSNKFSINWRSKKATCPQNKTSIAWKHRKNGDINILFDPSDCSVCPFLKDCTRGTARVLSIKNKDDYSYIKMMRRRQATPAFQREYSTRAGCEGTQADMVRTAGRQMRVRGLDKVHLHLQLAAVAINFCRLFRWEDTHKKSVTRTGKYQRLCAA